MRLTKQTPNKRHMPEHVFHLAQFNVARMRFSLDDPRMQGFVDQLDNVNGRADHSPGFVWRLQTDAGDATGVRAYDDESLIVNLSVWETPADLKAFVMGHPHLQAMKRRREWFEKMTEPYVVLWWVDRGHRPSIAEAQERLDLLRSEGPGPMAFGFARLYPPPTASGDRSFFDV